MICRRRVNDTALWPLVWARIAVSCGISDRSLTMTPLILRSRLSEKVSRLLLIRLGTLTKWLQTTINSSQ